MPTESAKAGKYELLADEYTVHEKDGSYVRYVKGDIVTLNAEQAERHTTGPRPGFGKPGESARLEAARLQAAADAAKARADAADARAAEADDAARMAAKAPVAAK